MTKLTHYELNSASGISSNSFQLFEIYRQTYSISKFVSKLFKYLKKNLINRAEKIQRN
jgi:hypothetical protein